MATVLQDVTLPGGRVADVRIEGAVVAAVGDTVTKEPADEVIPLPGHLVLPAAVEPHAHLDKAFLAERVPNRTGDLLGAIEAMEASRDRIDVPDMIERAERAAWLMARNGFVAIRTHADVTVDNGLRSVEALVEVRRRVSHLVDIEIVALTGWPVVGEPGADHRALLRDALALGADLVGGCPHLEDGSSEAATDVLLSIATEHGVGVDLHTDETLDVSADGLSQLARHVLAGFQHPATASHCVSLGQCDEQRQRTVAELVARAGIGVIALPHTNLYLQGRGRCPTPRALTAVPALVAAGVTVAAGADNLQDPFNPMGRACPFETGSLMVLAAHLLPADAWAAVSTNAAAILRRPPAGIQPGMVADLLVVPACDVREALAFAPPERLVWRRGVAIRETQS
ncbi:MAG TPA: amidohydrolase family protein [Ilumatobacteraceae bacterium]